MVNESSGVCGEKKKKKKKKKRAVKGRASVRGGGARRRRVNDLRIDRPAAHCSRSGSCSVDEKDRLKLQQHARLCTHTRSWSTSDCSCTSSFYLMVAVQALRISARDEVKSRPVGGGGSKHSGLCVRSLVDLRGLPGQNSGWITRPCKDGTVVETMKAGGPSPSHMSRAPPFCSGSVIHPSVRSMCPSGGNIILGDLGGERVELEDRMMRI
ncbi:hypothetical protein BDP55DRAFT_182411 [Colletotrichum godetiae]|uniref:Uncharacterized protein n=1 Tax=Colletotrichum godetiae TaxID=1209918 RepID=A0AAJ0AI59_9PEZI|nr:uncharacterized protein BDP55DRAFT_182411 [Colletotrichum godetiae]KAK1674337.1 hypothetical protein BDP55DRAFT_182411 [Colletotrichum godetiae]